MKTKFTDAEMIRMIWMNQIRLVASAVVDCYAGEKYGVKRSNNFDFEHSSAECRVSARRITQGLSENHLKRRIKKLISQGYLGTYMRDTYFFLDDPIARELFEDARNWWIERGLPSGSDGSRMKTAPMPGSWDELVAECRDELTERFADRVVDIEAYRMADALLAS